MHTRAHLEQRHLERADHLIAEVDARVVEQRERIAYLKEVGHDAGAAEESLAAMLARLDGVRQTRRAIESSLSVASAREAWPGADPRPFTEVGPAS